MRTSSVHGRVTPGEKPPTRRRFIWTVAVAALVSTGAVPASAGPGSGSEHSNGTIRFVEVDSGSYPSQGDEGETFYGFFSLEGVCGFERARMTLHYTETFLVALHRQGARAGGFNAIGKIEDEAFTLEVLDAAGEVVETYTGTADEHGTAVGAVAEDGQEPYHSNYSFKGTATSETGSTLRLVVKGRYRTDPRTGELRRFDYAVQSCGVT